MNTQNNIIKVSELLKQLKFAGQIVKSNMSISITENVLFNNGKIVTTNLSEFIIQDTIIDGTFLVNVKEFINLLSKLKKDAEIEIIILKDQIQIHVIGTSRNFKIESFDISDFPEIPVCENMIGGITEKDIETVARYMKYVSTNEYNPQLQCVYLNGEIVVTDGYRLSWTKTEGVLNSEILIHSKVAKLIKDFKSTHIFSNQHNLNFKTDGIEIITHKISEVYPRYKEAIPQNNPIEISVDKNALIESLILAETHVNKTAKQVRLQLDGVRGWINIFANDVDRKTEYSDSVACSVVKPSEGIFEIGFNIEYLLDYLKNIEFNIIIFEMSESNRAAIINGNNLLMPVQLIN